MTIETVEGVTSSDREFVELLREFDIEGLERHPHSVFGIWPDMRLAYVNPAWYRFADENGGGSNFAKKWRPGRDLFEGMPRVLHEFYKSHFQLSLSTGRPWIHTYECSSPEHHRVFRMDVLPVGGGEGLLAVNSLIVHEPHNRAALEPMIASYQHRDGLIIQCAHCRRVQRTDGQSQWDWVPEWVRQPPETTSHGLCNVCVGFYYSDVDSGFEHLQPIFTGQPLLQRWFASD